MSKSNLITNVHLKFYAQAADKLGIDYEIISPESAFRINLNNKNHVFFKASIPLNSLGSCRIAESKNLTSLVLTREGINAPKFDIASELDIFLSKYETFRTDSIVIKPQKGLGGKGITILPQNSEIVEAFYKAQTICPNVMLEEFVHGEHYRVLVLDSKVIAVAKRVPPQIEGTGEDTVMKLIEDYNRLAIANVLPGVKNHDTDIIKSLNDQGYNFSSILEYGKKVLLRNNVNLSTGGYTINETGHFPVNLEQVAIAATKALGLTFAGIDMIVEKRDNQVMSYVINEVNHNPGLRIHYRPTIGEPISVAEDVINYLIKKEYLGPTETSFNDIEVLKGLTDTHDYSL